jgi:hypothetical protein
MPLSARLLLGLTRAPFHPRSLIAGRLPLTVVCLPGLFRLLLALGLRHLMSFRPFAEDRLAQLLGCTFFSQMHADSILVANSHFKALTRDSYTESKGLKWRKTNSPPVSDSPKVHRGVIGILIRLNAIGSSDIPIAPPSEETARSGCGFRKEDLRCRNEAIGPLPTSLPGSPVPVGNRFRSYQCARQSGAAT